MGTITVSHLFSVFQNQTPVERLDSLYQIVAVMLIPPPCF